MDFIIHIGDAKCGSSAIQSGLWGSKDSLSSQKILYDPAKPDHGHYSYATLLGAVTRGDDEQERQLAQENILGLRKAVQLDRPDFVILSGESLFGRKPGSLYDLTYEVCAERNAMHIIAFVRDPVSQYLSMAQQQVTGSGYFALPPHFSYKKVEPLLRWRRFPGCRSLNVARYDKQFLRNGSVVEEFGAIISDITHKNIAMRDAQSNVSHTGEQSCVLQKLRQEFYPDKDNQYAPRVHALVMLFNEWNRTGYKLGKKAELDENAKLGIVSHNKLEVDRLRRNFARFDDGLPEDCGNWGSSQSSENWSAADLNTVLTGVDQDVCNQIRAHVYEYIRTRLEDPGYVASLLADLPGKARAAYRQYLRRCGVQT